LTYGHLEAASSIGTPAGTVTRSRSVIYRAPATASIMRLSRMVTNGDELVKAGENLPMLTQQIQ
jgi:hypothetical protein